MPHPRLDFCSRESRGNILQAYFLRGERSPPNHVDAFSLSGQHPILSQTNFAGSYLFKRDESPGSPLPLGQFFQLPLSGQNDFFVL